MSSWTGTVVRERANKRKDPDVAKPGRERFVRFKIVADSGEQMAGVLYVNKDTLAANTISAITLTY